MSCRCQDPEYLIKCASCNKLMFSDNEATDNDPLCFCAKCGLLLEIQFDDPIGPVEIIHYLCPPCSAKERVKKNG